MGKKRGIILAIVLATMVVIISNQKQIVYSENLSNKFNEIINNIEKGQSIEILEVAKNAYSLSYIDVDFIKENYVEIISNQDKLEYEQLGHKIISQKCLPITEEGIDLFAYVTSAEGMKLEVLEGDDSFEIRDDKLYLIGEAPAIAKVRLVNPYATSESFYIYGTTDREIHDFTYDYLLNLVNK